jgi:hypothetical protein
MIRRASIVVLVVVGAQSAFAQGQPIAINDLSAPVSPAFTLLDLSPASVEKPDTAKSFLVNAVNRITKSEGGLPKDIAMQVTPYWMKSHPRLTFGQYQAPSIGQSIAQTFAISVATSPIAGATAQADPTGTHVALGLTFRPWNGRPNPAMSARVAALEAVADKALDIAVKMATATGAEQARLKGELDKLDPEITAAARAIGALSAHRVGFFLTVSGGQVWDFPGDDTANAGTKRRGAWITGAYRMPVCAGAPAASNANADAPQCRATVDAIAVSRLLKDRASDSIVDYGGRLVWSPNQEFSASVEFLRRNAPAASATESTQDSNRTAGILEYKINESFAVFGTFGQDFEKTTGEKPLISLFGLNVGLGRMPTARPEGAAAKPAK